MKRLIVDSCIWFVLLDKSDDKHKYAPQIERVFGEDVTLGDIAVFSFNVKDFIGVNGVEVISPEWIQLKS